MGNHVSCSESNACRCSGLFRCYQCRTTSNSFDLSAAFGRGGGQFPTTSMSYDCYLDKKAFSLKVTLPVTLCFALLCVGVAIYLYHKKVPRQATAEDKLRMTIKLYALPPALVATMAFILTAIASVTNAPPGTHGIVVFWIFMLLVTWCLFICVIALVFKRLKRSIPQSVDNTSNNTRQDLQPATGVISTHVNNSVSHSAVHPIHSGEDNSNHDETQQLVVS